MLRRRERQRALLALGHGPEEAGEVPPALRRARLRQPPHGGLEHGRAVAAHQRRQRGLVRREPAQQARRRRADGRRVPLRERLGQEGAERVRQERRRGLVDGRRAEHRERAEARARRPHEYGPIDVEAQRDLVEAAASGVHGADRDARAARARGVDRPIVQSEAEAVRAPRRSARLAHRVPIVRRAEFALSAAASSHLRSCAGSHELRARRTASRQTASSSRSAGGTKPGRGRLSVCNTVRRAAARRAPGRRRGGAASSEQLAADADEPRAPRSGRAGPPAPRPPPRAGGRRSVRSAAISGAAGGWRPAGRPVGGCCPPPCPLTGARCVTTRARSGLMRCCPLLVRSMAAVRPLRCRVRAIRVREAVLIRCCPSVSFRALLAVC